MAHLYGVVTSQLPFPDFEASVAELTKNFKDKQVEYQHGAVASLGFAFGRVLRCGGSPNPWKAFTDAAELVVAQLGSQQTLLVSSACLALAEMGRCGPMPFDERSKTTKAGLIKTLLGLIKSGKVNMKVRERSAVAAGHLW